MNQALIGFGSNLGNRLEYLTKAIEFLNTAEDRILQVANIQHSRPMGSADREFINTVLLIETNLEPSSLLLKMHDIETALGRTREVSWGNRCIDLDLLLYRPYNVRKKRLEDCLVIQNDLLTLPHPEMHKRDFVLLPAVEVAADWVHPLFNKTLRQLKFENNYENYIHAKTAETLLFITQEAQLF
ncbi:MAG: 2-amino-4-hydroxy-6-hydroxymethyldihydropteridine diphosphokinase [Oligoflexales bacterium]|nr:2-amino-4-hydroxy-6-hydroxymethyldihydropteridine diphosphokinase [Oligoflexales bacterium]